MRGEGGSLSGLGQLGREKQQYEYYSKRSCPEGYNPVPIGAVILLAVWLLYRDRAAASLDKPAGPAGLA